MTKKQNNFIIIEKDFNIFKNLPSKSWLKSQIFDRKF